MTIDRRVFGANLTALKDKSGKSWSDISRDLGYNTPRYLLVLAAGQNEPRLETVRKIADYFGVKWQSMLEEDGNAVA